MQFSWGNLVYDTKDFFVTFHLFLSKQMYENGKTNICIRHEVAFYPGLAIAELYDLLTLDVFIHLFTN